MIYVNEITGVNTFLIEQGTPEWLIHRAGVITASRAHDIIKSGRSKGSYSEARGVYMRELAAQVCTGVVPESVPFKQAKYGHENEPYAREAYEARFFEVVEQCGLIYKDSTMRCGISPDGMTDKWGLEIKCPFTSAVHINTLLDGFVNPEYLTQVQYSMWVSGFERWDFASFDPRFRGSGERRLYVQSFEADEATFATFDREIPLFIEEMDEMLHKLDFKFGDQWRDLSEPSLIISDEDKAIIDSLGLDIEFEEYFP